MTKKELVNLVENSSVLSEDQKKRVLKLIPGLSIEKLRQLAETLLQGESTLGEMRQTNDLYLARLNGLFTAMNKHAVKVAKKEVYEFIEQKEKSDTKSEDILNDLKDA